MIAADTNVIVRLLTGDEPDHTARARRLFDSETVFLPKTVLLEAEWVLRSVYHIDGAAVIRALTALVALPRVRCEDLPAVTRALAWSSDGLDFADALHLASSRAASRFATFDTAMIKRAASSVSAPAAFEP